jgi:hypothetical protein
MGEPMVPRWIPSKRSLLLPLALVIVLGLLGLVVSSFFDIGVAQAAARPVVTGVSPRSGPTSGGNVVYITGTGFTGATSVRFGTVTTTHFTVHSSTKITVTVPPHAVGAHDVNVTTSGGRSLSNSVDKYTYK